MRVLLSAAVTVKAGERLTIAVSPSKSFAPTNLMVRVDVVVDQRGEGRCGLDCVVAAG